jgi:predicted nucleic acid-binding protein
MAGRTGKSIARNLAFWDASALVPLCVGQSHTPRAVALYKSYEAVVWWATPVEIASALARLVRMEQLDSAGWAEARRLSAALADGWFVVQPSNGLRAKAAELVNRYDLRAADALQLAAALEWCEDFPQGRIFLTADQKLREAALLAGFDGKRV